MSYKPEVQTDNTGKWYDNALRFETEIEALENARDLSYRWFAVRSYRATESQDPVNYSYNLETRELAHAQPQAPLARHYVASRAISNL